MKTVSIQVGTMEKPGRFSIGIVKSVRFNTFTIFVNEYREESDTPIATTNYRGIATYPEARSDMKRIIGELMDKVW